MGGDENVIKSVVEDFGLFKKNTKYFYSLSVKRRIKKRKEISKTKRNAAITRWERDKKDNAYAMLLKEKERKIKEKEEEEKSHPAKETEFSLFWKNEVVPTYKPYAPNRHDTSKIFIAPKTRKVMAGAELKEFIDEWHEKLKPLNKRLEEINNGENSGWIKKALKKINKHES